MKRVIWLIILILAFSFWNYSINPSYRQEEEVVKVQVFESYDRIHPGMDLMIAFRVDILGAWHINSNVPTEEFMEATSVNISTESLFSFSKIKYPDAFSVFLEFSERPVSVFEGEIFIIGIIPIPDGIPLGKHAIPLQFTYQACDDRTCLPPETLEKEITVTVVDRETPIQEKNSEIFTRLKM